MRRFHVTSSSNRRSVSAHGLDWRRMGAAPGIAGSVRPEAEGAFLCRDEFEREWFVSMNNTGGPVDVWAVDGIDGATLVGNGSGYEYFPGTIPATSLTVLSTDIASERDDH